MCEPLSLSSDYCVNHPTEAPVINASVSHTMADGKHQHAGRIFARDNTHDAPIPVNISASAQLGYLCVKAASSHFQVRICGLLEQKKRNPITSPRVFFPFTGKNQRAHPSHTRYVYITTVCTAAPLPAFFFCTDTELFYFSKHAVTFSCTQRAPIAHSNTAPTPPPPCILSSTHRSSFVI